jgi:hypothetical protein
MLNAIIADLPLAKVYAISNSPYDLDAIPARFAHPAM